MHLAWSAEIGWSWVLYPDQVACKLDESNSTIETHLRPTTNDMRHHGSGIFQAMTGSYAEQEPSSITRMASTE